MLRDRQDYLLRMIEQAAAAVAMLRRRLSGGEPPAAIAREARTAQGELLGKDAQMLSMLDARSAAHLLGEPRKLEQWVALLRVEAEALRAAGRDVDADQVESRASELGRQFE